MILPLFQRLARVHPAILGGLGAVFMIIAGFLVHAHVDAVITVRDVSVPIVGQLPQMEHRLRALQEQAELADLHAATRVSSAEEKIRMYVLPDSVDFSRLIATFEVIRDVLQRDGLMTSMSEISVSDPVKREDESTVRSIAMEFSASEEGLQTILLLVRISGLLTIGDMLTSEEIALLTDRVEQENPAGIVALEQFLSADLVSYAKDPKAYEQQLRRSFTGEAFFHALDSVLLTSLLQDIRSLIIGDLGGILQSKKLWPMQMMAVEQVSLRSGTAPKWYKVHLQVQVFSAES